MSQQPTRQPNAFKSLQVQLRKAPLWARTLTGTAVIALVGGVTLSVVAEPQREAVQLAQAAAPSSPAIALPLASAKADAAPAVPAPAVQTAALAAPAPQAIKGFELPADFIPANSEGSTENAPFGRIKLAALSNGQQAIDGLGGDLPAVAAWYGKSPEELTTLLRSDNTVFVDTRGRLLFIDAGAGKADASLKDAHTHHVSDANMGVTEAGDKATIGVPSTGGAPFPLDQTFALHSRSSASRIIYLNFKGEGAKPAFDLDKLPRSFSAVEQAMIQKIWLRVAEDYASFDVDITTEAPSSVVGKTGVTILITSETSASGGYAYLNSFAAFRASPAPAFCFQNNLANAEKPIAECLSHELGHTLGLHHQSTSAQTYYGGTGSGDTGWAPIMGVSYYKNLTQWAKGEYAGATNTEDAYAVMKKQGLPARVDDHGNTTATASAMLLSQANGLANLSRTGVIETPTDVDVFSFVAGAGAISLTVAPSNWSGNLDVALELRDASGKTVATANTLDKLDANISAKLATAGTYYLFVKGAGKGDPKTTGYSNYGSIGQYSISGTAPLKLK
ncbi:pre-peptidase C-terminal domain-containing protein [Roseateles albus]|uniref:Pre-peptidase C-terminal domain-containing protein n=1 Tax=Roseateles albus TaxID=2987525 RepID=A0ABT5KHE1_9BURK|nr:pre-peptidase C-terminal domain-containing protein [Roseateles albus]MDC8772231.1 pre-peptidase C-terminal domain-containing protein [Roseateles albus]